MSTAPIQSEVADRPFFKAIGYSNCWEDPEILQRALGVQPGDVVFSVTSGGCNTLSLLLHDPARVVALDFNPNQNHLLKLKIAAFQTLEHGELLELMGIRASTRRRALLQQTHKALPADSVDFWNHHLSLIDQGLTFCGRTDRFLLAFGKLMRFLYGRRRVETWFEIPTLAEQERFYREKWDGWMWRSIFDAFFSRAILTRAKDESHFRLVEEQNYGRAFRERAAWAMTHIPMPTNYFMALILLGRYHTEQDLPPYLKAEHFATIRERVGRVEVVTGQLEQYLVSIPEGTFARYNLSNLFDWISEEPFIKLHQHLVRAGQEGATLAWWNTLIKRQLPPSVVEIERQPEKAALLLKEDRAFLYANLEIGVIRKP